MPHYTITRAFQDTKQLTSAQRNSSLFAEEPVVLGKILRRGSNPLKISTEDYQKNKPKLLAQQKAGAIKIQYSDGKVEDVKPPDLPMVHVPENNPVVDNKDTMQVVVVEETKIEALPEQPVVPPPPVIVPPFPEPIPDLTLVEKPISKKARKS